MQTVVSGIRPTGNLHLGNYFGAVRAFTQMQNEYNCYFFIADWHSLTTHPHPDDIIRSTNTILAEYLACGIDPEKATIYVQSDVREVLELYLYLNMNAYLGELERGLATRPDDTAPRVGGDGVAKLFDGHLGARVKLRVAEAAAEVASAQADEDRGLAHVHTFAL